jgi:ribonuclease P protein component
MIQRHTLDKKERISYKKHIDLLFAEGNSFVAFPLRVIYTKIPREDNEKVSILVNVSKRKFKRAVKRNRLKRLIKEAYRLHKQILSESLNEDESPSFLVAFLYIDKELQKYSTVEKGMKKALEILRSKIS